MPLVAADAHFVIELTHERSGIFLDHKKDYLIESRLESLAKEQGILDSSAVVAAVRRDPHGPLAQLLVEAMTTHETLFFRDTAPFDALSHSIFPELILQGQHQPRIWCAACSSGQEPYSLAMVLERFREFKDCPRIMATDFSPSIIERAKAGIYSQLEVERGMPDGLRARYFVKQGEQWIINKELQRRVEFRELNLLDPWPATFHFDIIFMRNVLIYFDEPVKKRLLERLALALNPKGYLFFGTSEVRLEKDFIFQRHMIDHATVFRHVSK